MWDNHWWVGVAPQGLKGGVGAFVYRGLAPRLRSGARVAGLDSIYTSQQEGSEARREQIVGLGVCLLRIDNRVTKKVVVM